MSKRGVSGVLVSVKESNTVEENNNRCFLSFFLSFSVCLYRSGFSRERRNAAELD